jgi:hypothetical protein
MTQRKRNPDDKLRRLERIYFSGDLTVLPQLVAEMVRAGSFTMRFYLDHPQSFHFLPQEWQESLVNMGIKPPLPETSEEQDNTACSQCQETGYDEQECENITDSEGNECGSYICENCSATCPICEETLCQECNPPSDDELDNQTGAHRCSQIAQCCNNCGKDLFMQDQQQTWEYLSPEAADYLYDQGSSSADAGTIHCESCLEEYDVSLGDATGSEFPDSDED